MTTRTFFIIIIIWILLYLAVSLHADSPFRSDTVTSSPFLSTTGKGGERRNNLHKGWDGYPLVINGIVDWIVFPIMDGKVIRVDQNNIDGKYVLMQTNIGLFVKYCHAEIIYNYYQIGDLLTTDNYIMKMGKTGYTDGPHLHVEVYKTVGEEKIYYDPQEFFPSKEQQFRFRERI